MPAVTRDTVTLPRLTARGELRARTVRSITAAPSAFEGEGFPVRRAFAGIPLGDLDPFIHMDQMGEVEYAPGEPRGTDWHPHRGFETVTYMLDGTFQHQDSHGGGGVIADGATQWMTAGNGILHIETPPESLVISGGLFHGVQLWVNLPSAQKLVPPRYQNLEAEQVTLVASADGGALVRIIAGDVAGHHGPGSTRTPIAFVHATVAPGAQLAVPWPADFNALAYVLSGDGIADGHPITTGSMLVFGDGEQIVLSASPTPQSRTPNLDLLILGGQPIREPVAAYGPFVMNTRDELIQAVEDFQAGRLGVIPEGALMPFHPA